MSHLKRIYQFAITGLLTLAVLFTTAFSGWAGTLGSISLELPNSNITIHVYQIGTLAAKNNQWQLTRNNVFAPIAFSLDDLDEINGIAVKRAKAAELAAFAIDHKVPVYQQGVSDGYGSLAFSDMEEGVYLIVKTNDTADNVTIDPFFVTMPTQKQDHTGYEWNVTCRPKYEVDSVAPTSPGGSSGGSGSSSSSVTSESGSTTIVALSGEDVALGNYYNEDSPVPLSGLPQTGDDVVSELVLLFLMGVSMGGLVFLLYKKASRN